MADEDPPSPAPAPASVTPSALPSEPAAVTAPDVAFWCTGSCKAATDLPWTCSTASCNRHGSSLVPVPVVYRCPGCKTRAVGPAACTGRAPSCAPAWGASR